MPKDPRGEVEVLHLLYYGQFLYRRNLPFYNGKSILAPPLQKNGFPPHSGKSNIAPVSKREGGTLGREARGRI